MLELQYFKKEVTQRVGDILTQVRDYGCCLFVLVPNPNDRNRPTFIRQLYLSDMDMFDKRLATANLREFVQENKGFVSCLVQKQWMVHSPHGAAFFNFIFQADGNLIPVVKNWLVEMQGLRYERVIQFVFEYPVSMVHPKPPPPPPSFYMSTFGEDSFSESRSINRHPQQKPYYLTGATIMNWQLRMWGDGMEFATSSEAGTEYNQMMDPNVIGRGLVGEPVEKSEKKHDPIWQTSSEQMLALLTGQHSI